MMETAAGLAAVFVWPLGYLISNLPVKSIL